MFYRTKKANQYFLCSDDYMVIPSFDEKKCILRKIVRDKDNTFICFQCDHRTVLDNISQQSKKTSSFIHAKLCQTLFSDLQPVKPVNSTAGLQNQSVTLVKGKNVFTSTFIKANNESNVDVNIKDKLPTRNYR
jgi:hypothetical protein